MYTVANGTMDPRVEVPCETASAMPKSMVKVAAETTSLEMIATEKTLAIIKILFGEDLQPPEINNKAEALEDCLRINMGLNSNLLNLIDMILMRLAN